MSEFAKWWDWPRSSPDWPPSLKRSPTYLERLAVEQADEIDRKRELFAATKPKEKK